MRSQSKVGLVARVLFFTALAIGVFMLVTVIGVRFFGWERTEFEGIAEAGTVGEDFCREVLQSRARYSRATIEYCERLLRLDDRDVSRGGPSPSKPDVSTPPGEQPKGPKDDKPGHGYGDDNHTHTGPPGQDKKPK